MHCKAGPEGRLRIFSLFPFIQITWTQQQRRAGEGERIQQVSLGVERERSLPVEASWLHKGN